MHDSVRVMEAQSTPVQLGSEIVSPQSSRSLANQLSCLVAAKCTSKLQITDSDFAKQFKAFVRYKLCDLMHQFPNTQTRRLTGLHSGRPWDSHLMQWCMLVIKNDLSAAVRNDILAYPSRGPRIELSVPREEEIEKALQLAKDSLKTAKCWSKAKPQARRLLAMLGKPPAFPGCYIALTTSATFFYSSSASA